MPASQKHPLASQVRFGQRRLTAISVPRRGRFVKRPQRPIDSTDFSGCDLGGVKTFKRANRFDHKKKIIDAH
jgi:hypothetical protein